MHTTDRRIRGRKLQTIRKRYFSAKPLCAHCLHTGKVTQATELDHIVALTNKGKDDATNRQGLCKPCHALKTAQDLGYRDKPTFGPDGWPGG